MSNRDFNFPVSVLTYNAGLLKDALADTVIGPPVLARLSDPAFATTFSALVKTVTDAPAGKASQMGGTGTLTMAQNDALAEMRRLASAARRSASLAFKGNDVVLGEEFKVGNASYGYLKNYAWWDPLRNDRRFDKTVSSLAPKEETQQAGGL